MLPPSVVALTPSRSLTPNQPKAKAPPAGFELDGPRPRRQRRYWTSLRLLGQPSAKQTPVKAPHTPFNVPEGRRRWVQHLFYQQRIEREMEEQRCLEEASGQHAGVVGRRVTPPPRRRQRWCRHSPSSSRLSQPDVGSRDDVLQAPAGSPGRSGDACRSRAPHAGGGLVPPPLRLPPPDLWGRGCIINVPHACFDRVDTPR